MWTFEKARRLLRCPLFWKMTLLGFGIAPSATLADGGETCGSATIIGGLPYSNAGNTCGAINSYNELCPTDSIGPDEVYRYFSPINQTVDVTLCAGTTYDAKLYVYASNNGGCPIPPSGETPNDIACADTGCTDGQVPQILGLPLMAGVTYHFVVDGSQGSCGDYNFTLALAVVDPGPACCVASTCSEMDPVECLTAGGFPVETAEDCDVATCVLGACCLGPGICMDNLGIGVTQADCSAQSGSYVGGARCLDFPCVEMGCNDDGDCNDQDACTLDYCDQGLGLCQNDVLANCCLTNVDCLDGVFCNGAELCLGNVCQSGTPLDCDDGDPCTADSCDEASDSCAHLLIPTCCGSDADCEDGSECTINSCVEGACQTTLALEGTACGNREAGLCGAPDTCDGQGSCNPNNLPAGTQCGDPTDTICTDPDICDSLGNCLSKDAPLGTQCDDGDMCTTGDVCAQGICRGVDDGNCSSCVQSGLAEDPSSQIGFQALITDPDGNPIEDLTVDLTYRFYDQLGTPVGSPINALDVPVVGGVVSTGIPITETIFDGTSRELGVSVNGTPELTPRIPVRSSAQSFLTQCANDQSVVDHLEIGSAQKGGDLQIVDPSGAAGLTINASTQGTVFQVGGSDGARGTTALGSIVIDATAVPEYLTDLPCDFVVDTSYAERLQNADDITTILLDPTTCPNGDKSGRIIVAGENGNRSINLQGGYPAEITLWDSLNEEQVVLFSSEDEGEIFVGEQRSDGTYPIGIEANFGNSGSRITTDTLKIRGGSDLSELFDVSGPVAPQPGMVVVIDPSEPGHLRISSAAYDRKIAGVVSGAGDLGTGLLMGHEGTEAFGAVPVALTGRVYVWVDAEFGAVEPGDLITTSPTLGHAMAVTDYGRSRGAVLGKAMSSLSEGRGLVLVLVTLQ